MQSVNDPSGATRTDTTTVDQPLPTPRKNEPANSATPRVSGKPPATPEREKTSLARKLEISLTEQALRYSPAQYARPDRNDEGTTVRPDAILPSDSPRVTSIKKEGVAMRSPAISSAILNPLRVPSRRAPAIAGVIPPLSFESSSAHTPASSPFKPSSPRKLTRVISEKVGSAQKKIEQLASPRSEVKEIFDGMVWEDLSDVGELPSAWSAQPPLSPSYMAEPSRKRKADSDADKVIAKRVRFNEAPVTQPLVLARPAPEPEIQPSLRSSEIDQLSATLALSPNSLRSVAQLTDTGMTEPKPEPTHQMQSPIHLNLPPMAATALKPSDDGTADFPFKPNRLARYAIKARELGTPWIGKASGDCIAGRLQEVLDKLMRENSAKINLNACVYLQQLFGLLPAGVTKLNKTFGYALASSIASLGLSTAQWKTIENLHQQFDELNLSADPATFADFKAVLGNIILAKNKLIEQTERHAGKSLKIAET